MYPSYGRIVIVSTLTLTTTSLRADVSRPLSSKREAKGRLFSVSQNFIKLMMFCMGCFCLAMNSYILVIPKSVPRHPEVSPPSSRT